MKHQNKENITTKRHVGSNQKKFWRSIENRESSKAYDEYIAKEFQGDESSISGIERRSMLKFMGASAALAGVGVSCRRPEDKILPYTHAPEEVTPGIPNYFATAMPSPMGALGMLVESHEGRPTKVEGNPEHPSSLGAMEIVGQASVLQLYDPDRSRHVLKRDGNVMLPSSWSQWQAFSDSYFHTLQKSQGEGLAFLFEDVASPTFNRLTQKVKERFPKSRWYASSSFKSNWREAQNYFTKNNCRLEYKLENAKTILGVQTNFLVCGPNHLVNSKAFSKNRKIYAPKDLKKMNRLYVAEAAFSTTGANADHRMPVRHAESLDFLKAIAKHLLRNNKLQWQRVFNTDAEREDFSKNLKHQTSFDKKWIAACANDLAANPNESLISVGKRVTPEGHALAYLMNLALGAYGNTVVFRDVADSFPKGLMAGDLNDFVKAANAGKVNSLVSFGVNPIYASPKALNVLGAYKKIATKIHVGLYEDETARASDWHLPESHFMETWGDVRAWDGTASITQPLIAPLYQTKSVLEVLNQLADLNQEPPLSLVKATWSGRRGALPSESSWRKSVHDGVVADSAFSLVQIPPKVKHDVLSKSLNPKSKSGLELALLPSNKVHDGRFSNISWLQELPDPMTKTAWGNVLIVGPKFAKANNIKSYVDKRIYMADMVEISANGATLEVPVFVLPGVAPNFASLTLGYGRNNLGAIADGVGVNAYDLAPVDGSYVVNNVSMKHLGYQTEVATTQEQFAMNGDAINEVDTLTLANRDPARAANAEKFKKDPKYVAATGLPDSLKAKEPGSKELEPIQMTKPWEYNGNKWGMVIDLTSCTGCNACVVACQAENNIPVVGAEQVKRGRGLQWLRVDRYYTGDVDNPRSIQQPVPCLHCENAPCEPVCPVAATAHDKEGLNTMAYNRCIGTRYCANNCPVKVRRFNYFDFTHSGNLYVDPKYLERQKTTEMQKNPDVTIRYRGVMEKCTYCTQRIQEAKATARRDGRNPNALKDGDVVPACGQSCPTNAIVFGNLNDPDSEVNRLKNSLRNYDLLNELNIRPRTSYLAKLRNPNPELV